MIKLHSNCLGGTSWSGTSRCLLGKVVSADRTTDSPHAAVLLLQKPADSVLFIHPTAASEG